MHDYADPSSADGLLRMTERIKKQNMFNLTNKTSIITGGGSGIGKAISILFAQQGSNLFILDVDEAGANSTVEEIKSAKGQRNIHEMQYRFSRRC